MNKKRFALLTTLTVTLVSFVFTLVFSHPGNNESISGNKATDVTYTMDLDTFDENDSSFVQHTRLGNEITFAYSGYQESEGNWGVLSSGGYFRNNTMISGIESISIDFVTTSQALRVSYGWYCDDYPVKDGGISSENSEYIFNNEHPSFFEIKNDSENEVIISSIRIEYVCHESEVPLNRNKLSFTLINSDTEYSVQVLDTTIKNAIIPSTYLGKPVTLIPDYAFYKCYDLVTVSIPTTVTKIGYAAFGECEKLKNINVPDSVTTIGGHAFVCCLSLESIEIRNVQSFPEMVFDNCQNLKSITLPSILTSLGNQAFWNCYSLTSIDIPETCFQIKTHAFGHCESLESIYIPSSVRTIGVGAFVGLQKCTAITVDANNTYFCSEDGVLYNSDKSTLLAWPAGKKNYNIPSYVTTIGEEAFSRNNNIESIVIPDTITSIGVKGFSDCEHLKTVELSRNLSALDNQVFYGCNSLSSILMKEGLTSIGNQAFLQCFGLRSITLPNSLISIGNSAFWNCAHLDEITIPTNVQTIGEQAFYLCGFLKRCYIPISVVNVGKNAFQSCSSNLIIYCEAESIPAGWSVNFNPDNRTIVWGYSA